MAASSSEYGGYIDWRATVTAESVADTSTTHTQDTEDPRQSTEPRLHLQPEDDEGGVPSAVGHEATRDFESGGHTSDDLRVGEEGHPLHRVTSELPDASGRGSPLGAQGEGSHDLFHDEDHAAEDSGTSRSEEQENKQEKWDLSERIRKLVLGVDDGPLHDSNTDQVSVRQKTGFEDHNLEGEASAPHWDLHTPGDVRQEKEFTSRVGSSKSHLPRDKTKHFRPSQPFFKFNSVMREKEYQRINRIIRRETSSEAARRYIQRPENIPRRRLRHSGQTTATGGREGGPTGLSDTLVPREDHHTPT